MKKIIISAVVAISFSTTTQASVITEFNDINSFNAALSSGTSTLETFDQSPTGLFEEGVETLFDGFGISFTNAPSSNQGAGIFDANSVNNSSGTAINQTNSVAFGEANTFGSATTGDGPDLTFRFFAPITAFAFDFSDSDFSDSYSVQIGSENPFQLDIDSGASTFIDFFGFVSDTSFSSIIFSQTATGGFTEAFSIDNILTNGFSTEAEAAEVPAPTGISLMMLSICGFLLMRRKSK